MEQLWVFVSHTHTDNAFCGALVRALRMLGREAEAQEAERRAKELGG